MLVGFLGLVAYAFLVTRVIFHGFRIGDFGTTVIVLAVGLVVAIWWSVHFTIKPTKRRLKQATTVRPAPAHQVPVPESAPVSIKFNVAGTTFTNSDGSSRQEILRHLRFGDPPYAEKPGDLSLSLREESFRGDPAIAVLINGYQVGFVPKDTISEVQAAMISKSWAVDSLLITGGGVLDNGEKCSYGCSVSIHF